MDAALAPVTQRVNAERLREAGLRATQPRLQVLGMLDALGGHQSVDHLHGALLESGIALSRASVYNVVRDLAAHGLANTAELGTGSTMYESQQGWHAHAVCVRCGRIFDVPCSVTPVPADLPRGFALAEAQIIYRGVCPLCAESKPAAAG